MKRTNAQAMPAPPARETGQTVLAALVVAVVALGVLPAGLYRQAGIDGLAILVAGFSLVLLLALGEHPRAAGLGRLALALGALLGGWAVIQAWRTPFDILSHPAYEAARTVLPVTRTSIALDPAAALREVGGLVAPFLYFTATLCMSRNDETGKKIVVFLAALGALLSAYAVLRLRFLPPAIGFGDVRIAFVDLPTLFGERNAAATFLGLAILAQAGQVARSMYGYNWFETIARVFDPWRPVRQRERRALVYLGMLALTLLALVLTGSRSGLISVGIGLAVFGLVWIVTARRPNELRSAPDGPRHRRLRAAPVPLVAGLLLVGAAILALGLDHVEIGRASGFCNVGGVVAAVKDSWLFGTGLGSFDITSTAYRDPACTLADAWDRVDDTYLEALLTLGLVAPIAVAVAIAALAVNYASACRRRHRHNWASMMGLGALALVATQAGFDLSAEVPATLLLFAAVLGVSSALAMDQKTAETVPG